MTAAQPAPSALPTALRPRPPYVLIANPQAGKGRGERALAEAERVLRASGQAPIVHRTQAAGAAAALAARAAGEGAGTLVAVGGDGTLHEVLNGLFARRDLDPPPLGIVPVGTGNDYARALGLPLSDPAAAARALLEGVVRTVDVGRLEGGERGPEHFLNNVGLAFMAAATAGHERSRFLPGRLSYALGGFVAYLAFRADALSVSVGEVAIRDRFLVVHVAIGPYCGGGIRLTPTSRLDDGRLEVCLVTSRSKLRGLIEWPRLSRGEAIEDATVLEGRRVRVIGPRGLLLHADGELRRAPGGVVEVTLLPGALRVVAPSSGAR